jgi:hypothetical protein
MSQSNDSGLEARIEKLRAALQRVSETRFGWDGDCGVVSVADDALSEDDAALANQPAPTVPADALLPEILALAETGMCHGLTADDYCSQIVAKIKAHQPAQEQAEPWHDAVLAECMRIEAAYHAGDPERTLKELIDWHANGSDIAVTNKKLADNYLALTCSSTAQQEPVAAPQQLVAPQGYAIVPLNPTPAMNKAAVLYLNGPDIYSAGLAPTVLEIEESIYHEVYRAMIAAAPGVTPNCGACPGDGSVCVTHCKLANESPLAAQLDGGQEGGDHAGS